jgi:ATP-dependent DNA helicase DinG
MGLRSFVAIDLETTGSDPAVDRIMEIGLVRFREGVEEASLSFLIDPGVEIPLRIQHLTGIHPGMVAGKPAFAARLPEMQAFLGDLPLVAHNAPFDQTFLEMEFRRAGAPFAPTVLDTLELSRVVLPRAKSHRLQALCTALGIELERHHRAEDDARAAGHLFLALLRRISQMDLGLIQFIMQLGAPGNWPLTPLFTAEWERRTAAGESPSSIMDWIRPFDGDLHDRQNESTAEYPSGVNPERVLSVLGPGGEISTAFPAYEHRKQQLDMALAVIEAFNDGAHLLVEAGTGTGKSLAYLVPAFAWAKRNGERVAIATHTITLQEQLWEKDIPFLQRALKGTKLDGVKAAVVKGRPNYVCLRKWEEEATGADFLTSDESRLFHIRMASWLAETETGDRAELNLIGEGERHWADVMSETETCLGPKCKWYRNHCFAYRARKRARDAQILVLNHALLFADINAGREILPPFRHLILDEAHHVEEVATGALGVTLENWDLRQALSHLWRAAGQGFLYTVKRRLPGDLRIPARPPVGLPSEDLIERLIDLVRDCRTATDELFRLCVDLVDAEGAIEEEGGAGSLRLTPQVKSTRLWEALDQSRENAVNRLRNLAGGLSGLAEELGALEPPLREADGLIAEIQKYATGINTAAKAMDAVLLAPSPDEVTWIEMAARGERVRVALRSAPINVGDLLREEVWEKLRSVVLSSATLAVGSSFDHVKRRLGLSFLPPDRVRTLLVSSPFRYKEQALVLVPEDLPSPKALPDREWTAVVKEFLQRFLVQAGGRTLVLFTSHRQLRQIYAELKPALEAEGLILLGQGLDGTRGRLVDEFKSGERMVLFGSLSFWEGVDIPGDGLTNVVMVKLPFSPPGDPVLEARTEDLERRGQSAFAQLSLPQAVIRFKQGFGRLIRTGSDRGVVVVLDNRVLPGQTRYGPQFLKSLPRPTIWRDSTEGVLIRAREWLAGGQDG